MRHQNRKQTEANKLRQIEMVRRKYSQFDPERDYLLWIIADLYYPDYPPKTVFIEGQVIIKTRSGDLRMESQIRRTPYPNKYISQVSGKQGRRRLYGIPLVFSSFESLQEIIEIQIHWNIYIPDWYQNELPVSDQLIIKHGMIRYNVQFALDTQHPDAHWFTLYSKDQFPVIQETDFKLSSDYRSEFDHMNLLFGQCEIDEHGSVQSPRIQRIQPISIEDHVQQTTADLIPISPLSSWTYNDDLTQKLLIDILDQSTAYWSGFLYERTETIVAQDAGDFLVTSAFGFQK